MVIGEIWREISGHGSKFFPKNNRYIQIQTTETSMISPPPPYERKESNKKKSKLSSQSRGAVRRPRDP